MCCGGWGFGIEEGTFRSVQIQCDKLIFQPGHLTRRRECVCGAWCARVDQMRGRTSMSHPGSIVKPKGTRAVALLVMLQRR